MGAIQRREEWTRQPQYPVGVAPKYSRFTHIYNWGAGGLLPVNAAQNKFDLINNSALSLEPGIGGRGVKLAAGDTNRIEVSGNPFATDVCTYLWAESASTVDTNGSVIAESRYHTDTEQEIGAFQIRISATDISIIHAQIAVVLTASNARVAGRLNVCAVTVNGGTGRHAIFSNGRLVAETTPAVSYTHGTSAIGNGGAVDNIQLYGPLYMLAFAPVVISDAEIIRLTGSQWQLLEDDVLTVPFASSSNADLAGAAVVNPAASAAIALSVPMVAAGIVVATSGGAMQLALPMSGNATGQASTAGGVSLSVPMAVSALIQALATAGLSQSDPLAGGAAGVASSTGNMTLNVSMAGAALIQALAAANLTVTGDGMSGSAIVQPSAAGNMSLGLPLATSSLVVSNTSGSLTQIVPMQASSASASLVTGGLDLAVTMNTAALIEALAVVSLSTDKNMGGAGAANAATMGNLTLRVNMSTAAIIQAVAAGGLAGNGQLVGTPGYRVSRAPRSWKVTRKPRSWRVSE